MESTRRKAVEEFRAASRRVLRSPEVQAVHQARVAAAVVLGGAEPLQAALADWLYACPQQRGPQMAALRLAGGCTNFCVNGQLAGNCCTSKELLKNDRYERTNRQPAG